MIIFHLSCDLLNAVMQIIVRHHHFHKELTVAIVLASVAVLSIIMSTFCAFLFWRRNRQALDSKSIQSSGLFSSCLSFGSVDMILQIVLFKFHSKLKCQKLNIVDGARGLTLGPILRKFNSLKMTGKKGLLAMIEYSLIESATNKFSESNILGEGGFGCVYEGCFDGGILAAVKKLDGGGQDCEREFEVRSVDPSHACFCSALRSMSSHSFFFSYD